MAKKDAGLVPQEERTEALTDLELKGIYQQWRDRVHGWISGYAPEEVADVVLLVPDMMALVGRLIQDPRTPLAFKTQLLLASAYVILPVDFVPEVFLGAAGLADDVVVMSVVLIRLLQSTMNIDKDLLREHWSGKGDIVDTINEIVKNNGEVVNTKVWKRIRSLFGDVSPEPAVVTPRQSRTSAGSTTKRSSTAKTSTASGAKSTTRKKATASEGSASMD